MNGSYWQIEHGCPQCGAPVTMDETDRLLACPFCRTRLYLAVEDHFRYHIPPPAGAEGELLYIPYWRLRGSSFSVTATGVTQRFVDTSALAATLQELPHSLGLRPQVLKLRFVSPTTEGRFIRPELPAVQALSGLSTPTQGIFHQEFIGEAQGSDIRCFVVGGEVVAAMQRTARKGDFRKLWIVRINAACRQQGISYSRFIAGLKAAEVDVDRKVLADLAVRDADAFGALVSTAREALEAA